MAQRRACPPAEPEQQLARGTEQGDSGASGGRGEGKVVDQKSSVFPSPWESSPHALRHERLGSRGEEGQLAQPVPGTVPFGLRQSGRDGSHVEAVGGILMTPGWSVCNQNVLVLV